MLKYLDKAGFASILEVIVSSIIFMIASVGFFSSISMIKPNADSSRRELAALYVGKGVIEDLHSQVYANLWTSASSPLRTGTVISQTIGSYTVNYILSDVPGLMLRRLDMNIIYPTR